MEDDGLASPVTSPVDVNDEEAAATDQQPGTPATCKDADFVPVPVEDEDEEDVFFGPMTSKEKEKVLKYGRRRTAVYRPGEMQKQKRVTMAPSDLLPTLSEDGVTEMQINVNDNREETGFSYGKVLHKVKNNSEDKVVNGSGDGSFNDIQNEEECDTKSGHCNDVANGLTRMETILKGVPTNVNGLVHDGELDIRKEDTIVGEYAICGTTVADNRGAQHTGENHLNRPDVETAKVETTSISDEGYFANYIRYGQESIAIKGTVSLYKENDLRRDSLLVIRELENHRKDGKRCSDAGCSLCHLDDCSTCHNEPCSCQPRLNTNNSNGEWKPCDTKLEQSISYENADSDDNASDDEFLLMEQSCHESFDDITSPSGGHLDTTVECVTKSISKLRMKPSVKDQSFHAFCRYTPVKQVTPPVQAMHCDTSFADTPEEEQKSYFTTPQLNSPAVKPLVVFTEPHFSPTLVFKGVRKPLLFNDSASPQKTKPTQATVTQLNDAKVTAKQSETVFPEAAGPTIPSAGELEPADTDIMDIVDIPCQDKSHLDLNNVVPDSSENSFEDTTDSICSSEDGSNKENQPFVEGYRTPRVIRQGLVTLPRYPGSEGRPASLRLHIPEVSPTPASPNSGGGASPMTMEEILARKKAQMQQLRLEQQRLTDKLSRHSPSPGRQKAAIMRSPLTGSFRSPKAAVPGTLPRVRYKASQSLTLEGKELEAVTKLHTMCNSQRSVKFIYRPRKPHTSRIVTVVADARRRIKWTDLKEAEQDSSPDNTSPAGPARRRSIIKLRAAHMQYPYCDENPSPVIISKTAHHASSLQKAVIDKVSTCK